MRKLIITQKQSNFLTEITKREIDYRCKDVNLHPTDAQKEASNYKMAHISVKGMRISIENPKGSKRYYGDVDANGNRKYNVMQNHYGYFNITKGKDGDAVDVFIGPNIDNFQNVYAIDQNDKEGNFDETKIMLGFNSPQEAKSAYLSNYAPDWNGFRTVTGVSLALFKKWLYRGRKQRIPFSDYVEIQKKKINEVVGNQSAYEEFRRQVEIDKEFIINMEKGNSYYNFERIVRETMPSFGK